MIYEWNLVSWAQINLAHYLMKSHICDPVVIILVCSYSVRQVEPATSEMWINASSDSGLMQEVPNILYMVACSYLSLAFIHHHRENNDSHVSARSLQDGAFGWVHNQDSGLLNRTHGPLLVSSLAVKRAGTNGFVFLSRPVAKAICEPINV